MKRSTNIVVAIVILIAIFGFIVALKNIYEAQRGTTILYKIPTIDFNLASGEENHQVSIDISIEGKRNRLNSVGVDKLKQIVTEALKTADYEKMVAQNGDEYIKEVIKEQLLKIYSEEDITGVYISDFVNDLIPTDRSQKNAVQNADKDGDEKKSSRTEVMKGLFKNLK